MTRHGRLLPLLFLATAPTLPDVATANTKAADDTPAILWARCGTGLVDPRWVHAWGDRLQCGSMRAPLDHDDPSSRLIDIGLIRVVAAVPAARQGAIFFNFGGPGVSPLKLLPEVAALMQVASPSHPIDGDKHRIAEQFDLVAVVPRGLEGGIPFSCPQPLGIPAWRDTTVYLADWNWAGFLRDTRAFAEACSGGGLSPHMGTYQHVRDMERARIAMGEPLMNYVGISYGTFVGATYASTYPTRTGRFVLDSVMDYSAPFEAQLARHAPEKQELFRRNALRPALADPAFGIGTDAAAVMERVGNMPVRLRGPWLPRIDSPAKLAAMLTVADWVRDDMATWIAGEAWDQLDARLSPRIGTHTFSTDPAIDGAIRTEATAFSASLRAPPPNAPSSADMSTYYAVVCGDSVFRKQPSDLRAMANTIAARFPAGGGASVTVGLVCHHWRGVPRPAPPLSALAQARPMLMLQAEFDAATPFPGAMNAFDASPGARIVVARGMVAHGVFGMSATPCIERSAGRFLLTGELPAERLNHCDFVPEQTHPRTTREDHDFPSAHELRKHLRQVLRDS